MLREVRRKLAMAARVWDFFQAHPSDEPGHKELLARLEERLARADALALQQRGGIAEERAAVARRLELRRRIQKELLHHLVRVGRVVATEKTDLAGKFRLPQSSMPLRTFADMTRGMLTLALGEKELFVAKGLSRTLLDDLNETFSGFEKATVAAHEGRRYHVGASADLGEVTREVVQLVDQLDGLNRYRFRKDMELKAAWRSAREVVGPFGGGVRPEAEGGEVPPSGIASAA